MRSLVWLLFRVPTVILRDHDGTLLRRYAHRWGRTWVAHRHGGGIHTVELAPNGGVPNGGYVEEWRPCIGEVSFL